jgi:hypothetical protein
LFLDRERTKLIEGMKKIARNPPLGKVTVLLYVNGQPVRSIISRFSQGEETKGWIITMEDMVDEKTVLAN